MFYIVLRLHIFQNNESSIRIIGESLSNKIQFIEVFSTNGSVANAYESTGSNRLTRYKFQSNIDCSSNTDEICYYIARGTFTSPLYITKFDFSSPNMLTYAGGGSQIIFTTVNALNDEEVVVAGFNKAPSIDEHFFFRLNFASHTYIWKFQTAPLENAFSSNSARATFSHFNDAFTKFYSIFQQNTSSIITVLDPANGNLTEVKHIAYPQSLSASHSPFCGKISSNQIIVAFLSSAYDYHFLDIINTETWEHISYTSTYLVLRAASPIFNSNKIYLTYGLSSTADMFTLQAAYDKLHLTELFSQSIHTITDVTTNYTIESYADTLTQGSESVQSLTITAADSDLASNSDKTYKVTVNVFSDNLETYNGTVNDTRIIGPLKFDCYEVITEASSANFTNRLTFGKSDESEIANWMAFNSTTSNVSISVPSEISAENYTLKNTYTGVIVSSFTLGTNLTINITAAEDTNSNDDDENVNKNDDDH